MNRARPAMAATPLVRRTTFAIRWFLLALAVIIASLFLTWRVLAAADFAYPWFHQLLDIEATVAEYGPRNERRPGFERTDADERARLFGAIVDAVRADGRGLRGIVYHTSAGREIGPLLTEAEIRHLQDVASLVTRFERIGWLSLVLVPLLAAVAAVRRETPPSASGLLAGLGGIVAATAVLVLLLGPVQVFYWLHERVFPPDHQWFFWYEESLMSMLMQAPNLFGAIAVLWLVPAALVAALVLGALIVFLGRRVGDAG